MRLESAYRFFWRANIIMGYFSGFLIVVMMLLTVLNVVLRYIFRAPLELPFELTEYMLIACTFLPACFTLLENRHIAVDIIYDRLSPRIRPYINIFVSIMAILYLVILTWKGGDLATAAYLRHWVSETGTRFPLFPTYVIIPIGGFLLCLGYIAKIADDIVLLRSGKRLDAGSKGY